MDVGQYLGIFLDESQEHIQALNDNLEILRQEGLFPLPDHDYSQKYKWFRRMLNTSVGRAMLFHMLPLLKKER